MNEKKIPQTLNENDLSTVSGGRISEDGRIPRYSIGQMVRFYYTDGCSKETYVNYCWIGKILDIIYDPEGIFYSVELDDQARQVTGRPSLELYFDSVFDV